MRGSRWFRSGRTALAIAAVGGLVATGAVPTKASSSSTSSTYSVPTWWQKFQTVSAPGFKPVGAPKATTSVTVGSNVDVSNEPTPQSETSIAINPSNPSQIVAG